MKYNNLGYLISEGFKSVFKQKKMSTASIIIMCATMLIFGLFFLVSENINYAMKQLESQQGMKVIILDDTTEDKIANLKTEILKIDGVNKVEFVSKEDALTTMKTWVGDHQELLAGYVGEGNPFPASYFVTLTDLSRNEEVQAKILKLEGVEKITSSNDSISTLSKLTKGIRAVTVFFLVLLVVISIFIIAYTIKLTVYARRREISIMKYVGATNNFIRGPFIVEGVIIGVVSALITLGVVSLSYNGIMSQVLTSSVLQKVQISLYSFSELFVKILLVYIVLGIGIGIVGSIISMRKYLKV